MIILALDVGEKKIGLAIGDTITRMAFTRPALLVSSWDQVWPMLTHLVIEEKIEQMVVGWPLNTDGSAGPQTKQVEQFLSELKKNVTIPTVTRDERLTSQAVQREQRSADRVLQRGEEDSLAAQLLLESYLTETA